MSIQILPARLANQIAAGEVVERPASVVKELVENSLDAGATRIQIDIERGGHKLIRIRDNGSGINKEELTLALSRHATSKIKSLDDLEQIVSLGFRGEALASISSVSRLTLTSKTQAQSEAWQAYAEGRDMAVQIKPASHPVGTTIEVIDLFFNTPARRKFLRTEKTEFYHIEELIKRIALSRFDIAITLKHNGKVIRQYRAQTEQAHYIKRIAQVAGKVFEQDALYLESGDEQLKLYGWVLPIGQKQEPQYTYVNGRMMRDKLILHAIRQTFEEYAPGSDVPAFVLYLDIDAKQVDVNVHPAKHEVRFHQGRLVHDFIIQAVKQAISFYPEQQVSESQSNLDSFSVSQAEMNTINSPVTEPGNHYSPAQSASAAVRGNSNSSSSYRSPLQSTRNQQQQFQSVNAFYQGIADQSVSTNNEPTQVAENIACVSLLPLRQAKALLEEKGEPKLIDLKPLLGDLWLKQVHDSGQLPSKSLLLPVRINLSRDLIETLESVDSWLGILGFEIAFQTQFIIVKKLPEALYALDVNIILDSLLAFMATSSEKNELITWLKWFEEQQSSEFIGYQLTKQLVDFASQKPEFVASLLRKTVKIDLTNLLDD